MQAYPLTPLQQGMLLHQLYGPDSREYVIQVEVTLREELWLAHFNHAWWETLSRHPVLRTGFRWRGLREPEQVVHDGVEVVIEERDSSGASGADADVIVRAYLEQDLERPFELTSAPLMRLVVFRFGPNTYRFVWTVHHIVIDGRSIVLVLHEVFDLYEALCAGARMEDRPQAPSFRDCVVRSRELNVARARVYWREVLAGFTVPVRLPHQPAGNLRNRRHAEEQVALSRGLHAALEGVAAEAGVSMRLLVEAAWALLLMRISGREDVVFGSVRRASRRSSPPGAERTVGPLIHTVPVRVGIRRNESLPAWLQRLYGNSIRLYDYEHTPLVEILTSLEVPPETELFSTIVSFEHDSMISQLRRVDSRWNTRGIELHTRTIYPLALSVWAGEEVLMKLYYHSDRMGDRSARHLLAALCELLESLCERPERGLVRL